MKRSLLFVLALAVPFAGCKTAGPRAAPGGPAAIDPLRKYVDELRLLRDKGDKRRAQIDVREALAGGCSVAVRVRAAAFDRGTARFSLETLGLPKVGRLVSTCRRLHPEIELSVTGVPAGAAASELVARIDAVLQTPEAFLAAKGVRFDRPAGEDPAEAASRESFATGGETLLGRHVTAWPVALLSVDPWCRDPAGRVRQQSEVEVDAVVGTDGRLHRPQLRTALGDVYAAAVVRSLRLWRFEPAHRGDATLAARIALRPVLHVY
jgi:hypothetical protein